MATFNATDILNIQQLPNGRAGVWFLNWRIEAKPINQIVGATHEDFAGAGLYGICFDDHLIYIGSFLGNKPKSVNFSGDVVTSRWWTHIGAITVRGHRVHIARASLRALQESFPSNHPLIGGFLGAQSFEILHKGNGNLSPLRRLNFAAMHSHDFLNRNVIPSHVLSRFEFVYVRYKKLPSTLNAQALKVHIESAEIKLIKELAPPCNSTHIPKGKEPVVVNLSDVEGHLRRALDE